MGNDGGSIPTRRELVRSAARTPSTAQIKETQREQQSHAWSVCPLSHKPLARPIVSDSLGNLYNKDAVLRFLLPDEEIEGISSKGDCEEVLGGRVTGLKDVVELKFQVEEDGDEGRHKLDRREGWVCPVTGKKLGPGVKAVYIVPCGHVFSEEAVRFLKEEKCLQCGEGYEGGDVVGILPVKEEERAALGRRMQGLKERGLTHALKKVGKKRKKGVEEKGVEKRAKSGGNGIKNAATAMLTARVLEEEKEKKRRRVGMNENLDSLFSKSSGTSNGDFMTRGFTLPAGK